MVERKRNGGIILRLGKVKKISSTGSFVALRIRQTFSCAYQILGASSSSFTVILHCVFLRHVAYIETVLRTHVCRLYCVFGLKSLARGLDVISLRMRRILTLRCVGGSILYSWNKIPFY